MTGQVHELGNWSEERVQRLRDLWTQGRTASEIAAALGDVTRSGVLGKVHRLNLSSRVSSVHRQRVKPKYTAVTSAKIAKAKAARKRRTHNDGVRKPPVLPESIQPKAYDDLKVPISLNVPLPELEMDSCRWPNAEFEAPFLFCGHIAKPGSVYCGFHSRVAYQPPQPRRARDFERSARRV